MSEATPAEAPARTPPGSFLDGLRLSDVDLTALGLTDTAYISLRVAVHEDARRVGGVNLFGSRFGNYPQDTGLEVCFH